VDILPSSVTKVIRDGKSGIFDLTGEMIEWVPVFCASCGVGGMRVPLVQIASGGFVAWFCEAAQNNCAERYRDQTMFAKIPDEVFWAKVKQAQLESYGRELFAHEIEDQLHDPNSLMSKLARERYATC
jgi:hypothetical protein